MITQNAIITLANPADAVGIVLGEKKIPVTGVVADFNVGWMERYNREFGAQLHDSQVVSWDGMLGLTHFPSMDDFWAWAQLGGQSIFRELPAFPGALETMRALAADHRIVIISSKFDWAIPDTLAWMSEHRLPAREIHFVWDKTGVPCDIYLEDAPHNLAALVERAVAIQSPELASRRIAIRLEDHERMQQESHHARV